MATCIFFFVSQLYAKLTDAFVVLIKNPLY